MARDFEEFLDEDECCLECGEIAYTQSKILGVCMDCADSLMARDTMARDTGLEKSFRMI